MSEVLAGQVQLRGVIGDLRRVLARLEALQLPERVVTVPDDTPVDKLGLPRGVPLHLHDHGIHTVAQLEACCEPELLDIRNIGYRKVIAIIEALARVGRVLTEWSPGR